MRRRAGGAVRLVGLGAGLALAVACAGGCARSGAAEHHAQLGPQVRLSHSWIDRSVSRAYLFLNRMMDRYASGPTPRLVQSFTGGVLGARHLTVSETYDDAVLIDAYLALGTRPARKRAEVIGDALLYVQAHDPLADGRVRASYAPTPLRRPADVVPDNLAVPSGAMAWAGQALVQLYSATGRVAYLTGAEAIGNWLQVNCLDTRGPGGYTGGATAAGREVSWKSTEHNIDIYALFSLLATVTGQRVWATRAAWARRFIAAMWDRRQGHFAIGTLNDGQTTNRTELAEDINSWSYLALEDPAYQAALHWDARELAVTAGRFAGVSYCPRDRTGVWFEGTAHLADALKLTGRPRDRKLAAGYLSDIRQAQRRGPNGDGYGIIAASRDGLSDCEGDQFFASLHTGTTAWYILAATGIDPFSLFALPRLSRPARS